MTSPTLATRKAYAARRRGRAFGGARGGFTLLEILVVIGIILVLMGLLLPSIGRAWRTGVRAKMASDLHAISDALVSYRNDFGDYPRLYPAADANWYKTNNLGAYYLCRALIGPANATSDSVFGMGDGADGPGFRVKKTIDPTTKLPVGKVWGPYLNLEKFKLTPSVEIADRNNKPILYYPANKKANLNADGYVGASTAWGFQPDAAKKIPYYNANDNAGSLPPATLQALMGADPTTGAPTGNLPPQMLDFLLWSAGPDELFGPQDTKHPNRCDDVANFDRNES